MKLCLSIFTTGCFNICTRWAMIPIIKVIKNIHHFTVVVSTVCLTGVMWETGLWAFL